ncbi:MAG: 4Fe-4S ferredoxin [Spirochaetes bacterium GWB1_27_13]|nr:MAG: 4Fe-4S ferredoxin [Spirochaetes bacterium GWB1_27_13]
MAKSKVFFTNLRTKSGNSLLVKLEKLVKAAGIEDIDFHNKFTAIKIHFGEPGNLAYIRPNYVKVISNIIKDKVGKPFLTDANTLYSGKRHNAIEHLRSALENGFSYDVTGCDIIIADGLKGIDYKEIEINQPNCKTAKIATAIADAEIIISMNHFKGHEMTGFGGALKNLGMGAASRGGKLELHSTSKPKIEVPNCVGCNLCVKNCDHDAIHLDPNKKAYIEYEKCVGCGQCVAVCKYNAAQVVWNSASAITNKKIAEYTYAVIKNKPHFHINFIMNVSPDCDCWGNNDAPIIPDIGILASFDPVAIDKASVDMVNNATVMLQSTLTDKGHINAGNDKFKHMHPNTDWKIGLEHAESIGIGNMEYELINV